MASTTCPFCHTYSHMSVQWGRLTANGYHVEFAATCDQCHRVLSGSGHLTEVAYRGNTGDVSAVRQAVQSMRGAAIDWQPKIGVAPDVTEVPESIARAAHEAYSSRSVGNHMASVLMARTVVEATAKAKGIVDGTLAAKIYAMSEANLIRPAIAELAHEIRFAGNEMAHGDIDVPIDESDSEEILALMAEVLSEVFQGPARVARVKAKRQGK